MEAGFLFIAILVFIAALVFSNLGLGGGVLYVPMLEFIGGYDLGEAITLSLLLVVGTMISATINHYREGLVSTKVGKGLIVPVGIGVVLGVSFRIWTETWENIDLAQLVLRSLFSLILAYTIYKTSLGFFRRWRASSIEAGADDNDGEDEGDDIEEALDNEEARVEPDTDIDPPMTPLPWAVEISGGFASGALGIGGGAIHVPVMTYLMGIPIRKSIGTSSALIVPTALFGVTLSFLLGASGAVGMLDIIVLFSMALVGGFLGSRFGLRFVNTDVIRTVFLIAILVAFIRQMMKIIETLLIL